MTIERILSPAGDVSFRELDPAHVMLGVSGKGEVRLTKRQLEWIVVEGMRRLATMVNPPPKVDE